MKKYFGTDGIRGRSNDLLSADLALKVGEYLGFKFRGKKLIIGKDTRQSSDMLEHALAAGMVSQGADVYLVGVCATPTLAHVIRNGDYAGGVMISASHNPYYDNGLKVFSHTGYKISMELEVEIEAYLNDQLVLKKPDEVGRIVPYTKANDDYLMHLESLVRHDFTGQKIVLDLANGSAISSAEKVFGDLGAEIIIMNNKANGININDKAGSTYMEYIQRRVIDEKADMGFAFDGDADRCLAVDNHGNLIDGDKILYVLAKDLKEKGKLHKNTVVSTVMANLGFIRSMDELEIQVVQTDVGDRHVMESMNLNQYRLGGEQSGHIILGDYATTGDGVLTALMIAEVVAKNQKSLYDLSKDCATYPQVLKNIKVKDKNDTMNHPRLKQKIAEVMKELGREGRILVRASGTENLIRVMVEAKEISQCHTHVDNVINLISEL